jgi:negative regulator of sigma E activity
MNHEKALRLQAYLDNEVSAREAAEIAQWLARDEQARAIYEELQSTRGLLSGNELELKLPETREFYWSKIEREISRPTPDTQGLPIGQLRHWWLRFAAPLVGAALLVTVFVLTLSKSGVLYRNAASFQEIETPLEEANAISFHSQAAGMTVVWIASQEVQENQEIPED